MLQSRKLAVQPQAQKRLVKPILRLTKIAMTGWLAVRASLAFKGL